MKVLIVEDEPRAANRLERLIIELEPDTNVLGKMPSVAATIEWLDNNASPDLIFMDVRLEDGDSFEILSQRNVDSPIVFCTAYSDYALQAFAVNSIDYLLKPIVQRDLQRALSKYRKYRGYRMAPDNWPDFPPEGRLDKERRVYRLQFLVALAGQFTPVRTLDVIAARSYLKGTQLIDRGGRQWLLDDSLEHVESELDPTDFVRISRQCLVRLASVKTLQRKNGGYRVLLSGMEEAQTVSRARVKLLKEHLGK